MKPRQYSKYMRDVGLRKHLTDIAKFNLTKITFVNLIDAFYVLYLIMLSTRTIYFLIYFIYLCYCFRSTIILLPL